MKEVSKVEKVVDKYFELLLDYSIKLVIAILVFYVGLWVIKALVKNLRRFFVRRKYDEALSGFLSNVIDLGLKIFLIIAVVSQLGVATSSLVALLGAAGLAIGLSLQGSLSNFAGGIMIILMKPFKIGDDIESFSGASGTVKEISIFYTKLVTSNNLLVVIPNGKLSNDQITNYTTIGLRRDNIPIFIHYDSDVEEATEVLYDLVVSQKGVLDDPKPQVVVEEMNIDAIKLSVRYTATISDFWNIHWEILQASKPLLENKGIKMPRRGV